MSIKKSVAVLFLGSLAVFLIFYAFDVPLETAYAITDKLTSWLRNTPIAPLAQPTSSSSAPTSANIVLSYEIGETEKIIGYKPKKVVKEKVWGHEVVKEVEVEEVKKRVPIVKITLKNTDSVSKYIFVKRIGIIGDDGKEYLPSKFSGRMIHLFPTAEKSLEVEFGSLPSSGKLYVDIRVFGEGDYTLSIPFSTRL